MKNIVMAELKISNLINDETKEELTMSHQLRFTITDKVGPYQGLHLIKSTYKGFHMYEKWALTNAMVNRREIGMPLQLS